MRPTTWTFASLVFAASLATGGGAQTTQPATQPAAAATPAAAVPDEMLTRLAPRYTRVAAGFSFCPPIGGKAQQKLAVGADEPFVVFGSEEDRWTLKVLQIIRPEPTKLATPKVGDPAAGVNRFDGANPLPPAPGLLDQLDNQLQASNPGTQPLRKDVINIGRYDTGLLITRYAMGVQTWLHQQAIIQESPTHFFVVDWTTPSGWNADQGNKEDPKESVAVALFDSMLRTVQLFDTQPVKQELERRVYSGMAMGLNLAHRAETSLIPEQYYRVVLKGRDVGWMLVTEQFDDYNGKHGLKVTSTFSRRDSAGGPLIRVDAELFTTPDRKQPDEAWVSRTTTNGLDSFNEYGQSYKRNRAKMVAIKPDDPKKPVQLEAHTIVEQKLTVNQSSQGQTKTIERDLVNPYCYLPQAWTLLLPRLLPIKEHKTYAFMAWVPSEREIIPRYVDTEGDREVRFDGKTFHAWVIRDRISLEGDPTFHYFNADGVFLGSETPASGISIVPSDFKSLKDLYPNETFTPLPLLKNLAPPAGSSAPRLPAPSLMPDNRGSR